MVQLMRCHFQWGKEEGGQLKGTEASLIVHLCWEMEQIQVKSGLIISQRPANMSTLMDRASVIQ